MTHARQLVVTAAAWFGCNAVFAQSLSLEEALRIGEAQSPRLAAQRAIVNAATAQVGRAGELPDPKLKLGIENLPVNGEDRFRWDRDAMTQRSIGWVQEFPNSAKREARNQRAERAREVEGTNLQAQGAALAREIAAAWLDVHYTERSRGPLEELARQISTQLETLPASIARGRQSAAEGFALRQALEQVNDRLIEQDRAIAKARIALGSWVGRDAQRPLAAAPETASFVHPRQHLLERLTEHPQLRVFDQREALARAEVDVARSTGKSDWMLEIAYGQRRPAFDDMLTVMVGFELPLHRSRRQDRDVASRVAEVDQVRAMREDARRMHEAEVAGWLTDFDTAQRRIERFERILLPLARDRTAAALAAYQGGRGDFGSLLEAERAATENELGLVQALAERGRAWANLNFLYPQEARR
jgi:outer membrane protein, heavy metal efflux system